MCTINPCDAEYPDGIPHLSLVVLSHVGPCDHSSLGLGVARHPPAGGGGLADVLGYGVDISPKRIRRVVAVKPNGGQGGGWSGNRLVEGFPGASGKLLLQFSIYL